MIAPANRTSSAVGWLSLTLAVVALGGACAAPSPDAQSPLVQAQNGDPPPWEDEYGPCSSTGDCARGAYCCVTTQTCEARASVDMCVPATNYATVDVSSLSTGDWDSADLPAAAFGSGTCPEVLSVDVNGYRDRVTATAEAGDLSRCECEGAELELQVTGSIQNVLCNDAACEVDCCTIDRRSWAYEAYCVEGCWMTLSMPQPGSVTAVAHGVYTAETRVAPATCTLSAVVDTEDPNHHFVATVQGGTIPPMAAIAGAQTKNGTALTVKVSARRGDF